MIVARGVCHTYNQGTVSEIEALKDVNIEVKPGEFLAIIGPNGSGKSTLAKEFNALLVPTKGQILVKGMDSRDPSMVWAIRQSAGMVFQNPDNQIVATVVEEDVAFGPENLGVAPPLIRKRVDEALSVVDMSGYAHHAPHNLSGGQKQRVAIAGVLAMEPEVLILDEPTAMLDPAGRAEVMNTVRSLNKERGITVIHITHFMEEAIFADRVIVMYNGRAVKEGTPKEVFSFVDDLKKWGLDVPQVTELARELISDGLDIPGDILTIDEMVNCICRLL